MAVIILLILILLAMIVATNSMDGSLRRIEIKLDEIIKHKQGK